ncbi:hypothetical protein ACIBQ1_10080 [Nonomuraea sp. NPDC050153]|uniref:hypothetical protein n=1 Tax=Nonomuraea sp. NPDC050153 TaxID=3364359 RepID=UPI0037B62AD4
MSPIVAATVVFLAVFALVQASIVDPPESPRTPRRMQWWHPFMWIAAVSIVFPLYTCWSALRFALYLVSFATAWASVGLATATAMDGRAIRVYRVSTWQEVSL